MKMFFNVSIIRATAMLGALSLAFTSSPALAAAVSETSGYDVSYPQCASAADNTLPTTSAFSVVGVNGGRVWDTNNCLVDLLEWAGADAQLYINTGNPTPEQSAHWPLGKTIAGHTCSSYRSKSNTSSCSFVYGYLGARDSYLKAKAAFPLAGITDSPKQHIWWLDVELSNSWRQYTGVNPDNNQVEDLVSSSNQIKNRASLSGAVYYLENVARVKQIGFYSTAKQWGKITGSTKQFSDHPVWYANGPGDESLALDACDGLKNDGQPDEIASGFTGSAAIISQYVDTDLNLDVNVPCADYAMTVTTLSSATVSKVYHSSYFYLKAVLKTSYGTPAANRSVSINFGSRTYNARTDSKGIAKIRVKAYKTKKIYSLIFSYAGDVVLAPAQYSGTIRVR